MSVKFKNPEQFQRDLITSGHTLRSFSKKLGKDYCFLAPLLKRNALSPQSAYSICKELDKKFDDIFLIEVSSNDNRQSA